MQARSDEPDADRNERAIERADPRRARQPFPLARDEHLEEQRRHEERDDRDDGAWRARGIEAHGHEEQDARTRRRLSERVRREELLLGERPSKPHQLVLELGEDRGPAAEAHGAEAKEQERDIEDAHGRVCAVKR